MKSAIWAPALIAATLIAGAACAQPCGCGQGCSSSQAYAPSYWDECAAAFHDNLMWPKQYIHPSRRGICAAFAIQANNGWRRNNLLGKYHFNPEDQQLSDAGKAKVDWILTQAPPERRSIFVERAPEPQETANRIQAVQDLASTTGSHGAPVDVQESTLREVGHPAGTVDAVFTGFSANQRPPMLPESGGSSSSSGSSDQ
jgi:hypothetical protein